MGQSSSYERWVASKIPDGRRIDRRHQAGPVGRWSFDADKRRRAARLWTAERMDLDARDECRHSPTSQPRKKVAPEPEHPLDTARRRPRLHLAHSDLLIKRRPANTGQPA